MKEETGLEITVGKLLYVCDRLLDGDHTVHLTSGHSRLGEPCDTQPRPPGGSGWIRRRAVILASLSPRWTASAGIGGRFGSERVDDFTRNTHIKGDAPWTRR